MIIRKTAIGHKYNGITAVPSEGMTVLSVKIKEDMNICIFGVLVKTGAEIAVMFMFISVL